MASESKAQIWVERIAAFERSGLSRRAWCATQGLNKTTLDYWRKQLRRPAVATGPMDRDDESTITPAVLPIVVSSAGSADSVGAGGVRIELLGGMTVSADTRVDARWLASLLRAVVGC